MMSGITEEREILVDVDEDITKYDVSEWRGIIRKIKEMYERTLRKIEELGSDGAQLKIKLMTSRISELEEENAAFLKVVEDLLEKSASSTRNEELHRVETEKLQSDVSNLLKFIRRAREEGTWDATGLNFNNVTHEDLFGSEDIFSVHVVRGLCEGQLSATVSVSVETESTEEN